MRIRRRWRNHYIFLAAQPQDHGGDEHKYTRDAEGDRRTELPQKNRHQKRSEERAEINDPIEGVEYDFRAMFVRLIELIAHKRGYTWFDPARAERDQRKPDVKTRAIGYEHRQARLA